VGEEEEILMIIVSRRLFCGAATATVLMTPAFRSVFAPTSSP